MSEMDVRSSVLRTTKVDYLNLVGTLLYAGAAVLFIIGFYIDWKYPEMIVISQLTLPDSANSGVFVLALILIVLGYLTHRVGAFIEALYREEIDQTQEWDLDVE